MPEIKPDAEKGMTFTAKVRLFEAAAINSGVQVIIHETQEARR